MNTNNTNKDKSKYFGRIYLRDIDSMKLLNKSQMMVFLYLKVRAGAADAFYTAQRDMARELGLSFSTIQKAIYKLREHGIIRVEQRGRKLSNRYHFTDTHRIVSNTKTDTHRTVSNHKLEEKEKDNNNNYKLINRISSFWKWNIDARQYEEICQRYPKCNHDVELLIIDAWLRKKKRVWTANYAIKGIEAWFGNIKRTRNMIPAIYRNYVNPELIQQKSYQQQPSQQPSQQPEQPQKKRDWISSSDEKHQIEVNNASSSLKSLCSSLEIEKGKILNSFQLKNKHPEMEINQQDIDYVLSRLNYEGFFILASIFGLDENDKMREA